jgi:hypothetical protein
MERALTIIGDVDRQDRNRSHGHAIVPSAASNSLRAQCRSPSGLRLCARQTSRYQKPRHAVLHAMAVLALSVADFNLSNSARNIAWKAIKLRRNKALPVSKSGSTSLEANETKPVASSCWLFGTACGGTRPHRRARHSGIRGNQGIACTSYWSDRQSARREGADGGTFGGRVL